MFTMNSRTFKTILICIILWQKTASSISIGLSAKTIFCIANHHIHNPPDESLPLKSGESQFQIVSQKEGGDQKKKNRKTFVYKHDLQGTHHFHPSSQKRHKHPMFFAHELKSILQKTFLPSLSSNNSNDLNTSPLYPKGYISYSIYNAIQDLSTQLRSVVATQRILEGVGVGKEGATAVSASLNFILRDGAGMLASLFFTARNGSSFGKNIKQWKLFADLIVDVGIFLEVLTLCLPPIFFLPVLCIANMCKALCGVAAGSSSGAISLYWAEKAHTDISDIHAKFGAQNTITGGLGLVFAAIFARSLSNVSQLVLWGLFTSLTIIHILANIKCMRLVTFHDLNTHRFNMVAIPYLDNFFSLNSTKQLSSDSMIVSSKSIECKTPEWVSKREPLFFFPTLNILKLFQNTCRHSSFVPIYLGVPIEDLIRYSRSSSSNILSPSSSLSSIDAIKDDRVKYVIAIGKRRYRKSIFVSFRSNVTNRDKAKAYFQALLLSKNLNLKKEQPKGFGDPSNLSLDDAAEQETKAQLETIWESFVQNAQLKGWDLSNIHLNSRGFEYDIL